MIAVVGRAWNGLGKVGVKSHVRVLFVYRVTLVMPNGISARYQGKAHDGACREWMYFNTSN